MRKAIFSVLILSTCLMTYGQLSVGPRIGINNTWVMVDENFQYNNDVITYKTEGSRVGFHVGAFSRIALGPAYVQPELLFSSTGGKVAVESPNIARKVVDLTYNELNVPVMAGLKMLDIFRVQAGPVFSLLLSDDARDIDALDQAEQHYNKSRIGFQAGVGLDIGAVYLDLKYEGNLSKAGNSINIGNESFDTDMRNALVMLSLGINLL